MAVRRARCFCVWLSAHGRRGGAKRRRTLCQRAGAAPDTRERARLVLGCPFCTWLAQAQVGWNSLFSTSGKPFPWGSRVFLGLMGAGGRLGYPWYRCGGALVHCRAALTKAAKGRLWGALGVWGGGIGLFLHGSVLAATVHPAKKPDPGSESRVKTRQGDVSRQARID